MHRRRAERLAAGIRLADRRSHRARHENHLVADAPTTTFTINAGGVSKQVSAYALGLDSETSPDSLVLKALGGLTERLGDYDQGKTLPTEVFVPTAFRGVLFDNNGFGAPDTRAWPWTDIVPADFTTDPTNTDSFSLSRTMSEAELAVFNLTGIEGGFFGMTVNGPGDGKVYSISLRPFSRAKLPDGRPRGCQPVSA